MFMTKNNTSDPKEYFDKLTPALAWVCVFLSLSCISKLRFSLHFGKTINQFTLMFNKLKQFLLMGFALCLAGSVIFTMAFQGMKEWFPTLNAFFLAFSSILGEFNLIAFSERISQDDDSFGFDQGLFIIWLVVMHILYLNVVIAVMIRSQNTTSGRENGYQRLQLLKSVLKEGITTEYNGISAIPPPWNVFSIPFILPAYIMDRSAQQHLDVLLFRTF